MPETASYGLKSIKNRPKKGKKGQKLNGPEAIPTRDHSVLKPTP
jgi:hypothetical protein